MKKTLEVEREAYRESLTEAIVKERIKSEDQLLMVQLYVSKAVISARISLSTLSSRLPLNVCPFLALPSGWK